MKARSVVVPAQAGTHVKGNGAPAFAGATVLVAMLFGGWALAQDKAAEKKKMDAKKVQVTHKKPTPEQIRRFNELEKKQQK